ncbi:hypothetical protein [Azospirillum aestuarii]|uniref:hypothetical protein n=1 Tax=Azospirillum aestuarii TaxID=2802052 RepID=UPI0040551F84
MTDAYADFLRRKTIIDPPTGLADISELSGALFDFQGDITRWALKRGRAALFAGTGLGKTLMELSWAQGIHRATGGNVLILAPLAVAAQICREAQKFGVPARQVSDQSEVGAGVNVTNYHKLHRIDLSSFVGVALDESSILKSTDGKFRTHLIRSTASIPFRLAATATPAPNDFMELGNHAEFLGVMSYTDMLATFFVHDGGDTQKWRLKGHAEDAFWHWMAQWAVMIRSPADLGYAVGGYDLPELRQVQHTVQVDAAPSMGTLFAVEARTMSERLAARRDSVAARAAMAASITPGDRPFVWWCNLNAESDALARAIPGAVEVRGSDTEDTKERKLADFAAGRTRVLVTKPTICGFGLNWQHCADTGFVGLSDSWEQVYQAIRRFWRFGQTSTVTAHFVAASTEGAVVANLRRKEVDAERMAAAMLRHMADLSAREVRGITRDTMDYRPSMPVQMPGWVERIAS